jgi:hypothetical protein
MLMPFAEGGGYENGDDKRENVVRKRKTEK